MVFFRILFRSRMPCSGEHQIKIEKSANYITSKEAARRIYEMNPNVKLLIMVRNPTKRFVRYSHFNYLANERV